MHEPCGGQHLEHHVWKKNDTQTGEDEYPVYCRRDTENGKPIATLNIRWSRIIKLSLIFHYCIVHLTRT